VVELSSVDLKLQKIISWLSTTKHVHGVPLFQVFVMKKRLFGRKQGNGETRGACSLSFELCGTK
jgi:hypothetical protein